MDLVKKIDDSVAVWQSILSGFADMSAAEKLKVATVLQQSARMITNAMPCEMLEGKDCINPLSDATECIRLRGEQCQFYDRKRGKCVTCSTKTKETHP